MDEGTQLGNYVIRERLGRGATAEVYRAFQPAIERDVAIKAMFPHLNDSPDFNARFQREARAMGQLQHPNIGRVIDFDASVERPYMVMEYLQGGSLQEALDRANGPLPLPAALQITRQLADALRYAHGMGMVHRDIKPANVMFTDDSMACAMLMDFGMARLVDEGMTATGAILGTPAFMAPEQVRGEQVSGPADIYSLGVMLFEMVTGQAPYPGDSVHTIMMNHAEAPIPSARAIQANIPVDLDALITAMLAKQPGDRPADAGVVVNELDRLMGAASARWSNSGRDTIVEGKAAEAKTVASSAAASRSSGRSRLGLLAAVVAVLLIAAGTVIGLTRGGDDADGVAAAPIAEEQVVQADEPASNEVDDGLGEDRADDAAETPTEPAEPVDATEPPGDLVGVDAAARATFDPAAPPALFVTSAQMDGDDFVMAWDRTRPAPGGADYELFLDGASEPAGVLAVDASGRGALRIAEPVDRTSSIRIAVGDAEVLTNTLTPAVRAGFDTQLAAFENVEREVVIVADHAGFIGDELDAGNLDEARRHIEHVINIIDGSDGPRFGDLDGSGLAENPGDGIGITTHSLAAGGETRGFEIDEANANLIQAQDLGIRMLSADSVAEAAASFDELEFAVSNAASAFERIEAGVRTDAVRALLGTPLALTGTDTSTGTMAFDPESGRLLVSTAAAHVGATAEVGFGELLTIGPAGVGSSVEPVDPGSVGQVVLKDVDGNPLGSNTFDPITIDVWAALSDSESGLVAVADGQAQILADHADLMLQEVQADNHSEVRRHAEHVVNIVVGEQDPLFGDLDGDGAAQNPGDGLGVLIHLDEMVDQIERLPAGSVEQRFYQQQFFESIEAIRAQVLVTRDAALQVVATDSTAEAALPTERAAASSALSLVGTDADGSGFLDADELGLRALGRAALTLVSAPLEP